MGLDKNERGGYAFHSTAQHSTAQHSTAQHSTLTADLPGAGNGKRNLVHLEFLRIVAIYLVMFNHTGNNGFFLFSIRESSSFYFLYLFMSIACKIAVPIFFMISGALLLRKNESIRTIYTKRILKFVLILLAISVVYQIYYCTRTNATFAAADFLKRLYTRNLSGALWYMYAYLGILLMLPVFRKLAQNLSLHEYIYMAGMSFLFIGVLPILEYYFSLDDKFHVYYCLTNCSIFFNVQSQGINTIFFFLMGYFFEHILPEKYYSRKNALIGLLLSIIAIIICCYMTILRAKVTGVCKEGASQRFHNSLIAIPVYTAYFSARLFFMRRKISPRVQKLIISLGGTTFGIYLLEGILRRETQFVFKALRPTIGTMPACLIWILCAFILGVFITLILKRVPIIRKYI